MTGSSPDTNQQNTLAVSKIAAVSYEKLYLASLELTQANSMAEICEAVSRVLAASNLPAMLAVVHQDPISDEEMFVPYHPSDDRSSHPYFVNRLENNLPLFTVSTLETSLSNPSKQDRVDELALHTTDCLILDVNAPDLQPSPLLAFAHQMGFISAVFIPVALSKRLELLLILGSHQVKFTSLLVKAYIDLADLVKSALERLYSFQVLERRLTTLQSLNTISQVVAMHADLDELYGVIHKEVGQLFGEISFFIALYYAENNMVEIPYLYEMNSEQVIKPPPFVLGIGLTSLVIQNRQPILIVEDSANRLKELGAQQTGLPAKSWMGVPLLVAGESTGAIVIQDLYHEHRFDTDDLHLMETIASQVAVTVRYVRLLNEARLQAERERALYEITTQIRASTDAQKILQTAAREVSRAVGARRARFIITPSDEAPIPKSL